MNLMKNVKLIETKVTYSSKGTSDDKYMEHGLKIVQCPSCKKITSISYHYKNDKVIINEKYCLYCGNKLVKG